jgi:cell shape-determining protein MreC
VELDRWQRATTTADSLELEQLRDENADLRKLLGLRARQPWGPVPAEVLRQYDLLGRTLLLSAGSDQGVKPDDPVIAPQPEEHGTASQTRRPPGLLGVVQSTTANTSVVILWTDPNWRAGAMTADGKALGIVGPGASDGPNSTLMELSGVPFLEVVDVGTQVVTSGMGFNRGGVYPQGLLLGVIEGIGEEPEEREGWSRTYILRPAVQPIAVSHVIILTRPSADVTNEVEADST